MTRIGARRETPECGGEGRRASRTESAMLGAVAQSRIPKINRARDGVARFPRMSSHDLRDVVRDLRPAVKPVLHRAAGSSSPA